MEPPPPLGLGIGWRPELALDIDRRDDLGFVEIVAENISPAKIPTPLRKLRNRNVRIIPHGISLSLGGAEPLDRSRLRRLADLARELDAPLVSEHIAFVRAGGVEAGHLLPLPRTRAALDVLIDNVRAAQDALPVPLALENIAALFDWPDREMDEAEFLGRILDRTGAMLLLDVANVWANARNLGGDPQAILRQMPLDRLAYVHVAGGMERDGTYHDTHAAPVPQEVLDLLADLAGLTDLPGFMLERDDHFPSAGELNRELDAITTAVRSGRARRDAQIRSA
jgi:uncharacterized protein (UPF0276 family)